MKDDNIQFSLKENSTLTKVLDMYNTNLIEHIEEMEHFESVFK